MLLRLPRPRAPLALYAPASTLKSSNATWDYWDGQSLGSSVVDYQDVAHGYNSTCPADGVSFDVKSTITANVTAGKKTQTFALTGVDEQTDKNSWKEFLETSPTLSITYNHKPNQPTGMTTSPATSCAAATPTVVGDGQVTLYAPVSDKNRGVLGVTFNLWKTTTPGTILASSNPNSLTYSSGTTAVLNVPVSTLRAAAGGVVTTFSWTVRATDFNMTSDWSTPCRFSFDPTRTGAPTITPPAEGAAQIGQSVTIPVSPSTNETTTPSSYLYQLNGGPYGTVTADDGNATIAVIPTRFTNTVTVTGLSAGGNVGDTASVTFNANPAATAVDGDLNGDNITDLLTAGGRHNLASGVWLASGKDTGALSPAANNIGARGIGGSGTGQSADFDDAQIITGRFTGSGLQDILAYYPTGARAGAAVVLHGNGDGSTIQAQLDGTKYYLGPMTFSDENGSDPLQLANAGHQNVTDFADLIGIAGNADIGYYLNYYPASDYIGYNGAYVLTGQTTPAGGADWNTWTIATAQTAAGTAMYLWQASTGKLYLWDQLTYDAETNTLTYGQHLLSNSWNTGQTLTPHAGDIDGDGTADLWTVGANATATAWLVTDITGTSGTVTAQPAQKILTGTHAWLLNDADDGPITGTNTAKDSIGTLTATGAGNAVWNTGDLFDPDAVLDGGNATVTTTGPAVSTGADFTVDVWAKATSTSGGTVLSQDGTNTAGFRLWAESSNSSWRFGLAAGNTANTGWTVAAAPAASVKPSVWAHLTASYKASTGLMDLHINGVDKASAVHLTPWNATGAFRIGAHRTSATAIGGYFKGEVAEVLTYNQVVIYDDGNDAIWDFDGDRKPDLIAADTAGRLYLYRGNGAGGFKYGFGANIGNGWDMYNTLFTPGDFNGDGYADVIARKPDGKLYLHPGNGAGGWITNHGIEIGSGWDIYNTVFSPGDFNGDGHPDVIARKPDGKLYLHPGNGAGGWITNSGTEIGSGWDAFNTVFSPGDFNGDGHPDVIARNTNGDLYLARGNGAGGWISGTTTKIGTGWQTFTTIF